MIISNHAIRFLALTGLNGILFGSAISVLATNYPVGTDGLTFSPSAISINVGDSVTWNDLEGGGHTTTSSDSLWNSSTDGYTFTFNNAGTFNYYCIPHAQYGMVGSVTVNAVATPPTVTISSPASGTVFAAPATVNIQASAAASSGSIANVKFLVGSTVLATVATAPFSASASNLTAANYTLSAIATDSHGLTATNSVAIQVINPHPVTVSSPAMASAGHFQFSYSTDMGLGYIVQMSTNVTTWVPVATNSPAASSSAVFSTSANASAGVFYRVERM